MTSAVPRLCPALSGRVWGSHAAPLICAVCWGHSPIHEAGAHQRPFPSCQLYTSLLLLWFYLRFLMAPGAKPSMGAPMAIPTSVGINTLLMWGQEQSKTWKAPGSTGSKGAGSQAKALSKQALLFHWRLCARF